ncbi:cytochrome c oxidase assembly factor 1 homolog [Eurosta solidaginis]|uniref:cytochrome c oxidase assembly factor 1 homolog n=1 Tax=Eurosta solidaginis TaxID=178769 RepID=UPI0035314587
MRFPANKTLGKIAVYTGVVSISAVMYMRHRIEDGIRNSEYYRVAMQTLKQHKGAASLLGEPIKDLGIDLTNKENFAYGQNAHFEVNVKGPKEKGKMYFWATHIPEQGWQTDRLELEVHSQPEKRYLIKKAEELVISEEITENSS